MIKLLLSLFCLLAATAPAQLVVKSPWTSTADPATARAGLGIYETNAAAYNVTNVFTNFSVPVLTVGLGTNAVTLAPTNGTLTGDVSWIVDELTANAITLGGTRRTTWPEGGTNNVSTTNSTGTRYFVSFQTNDVATFPITIGTLTNGAAYYTLVQGTNNGTFRLEYSVDGGSNWLTAEGGYNANALFRFSQELAPLTGSAYVSNLVVYSVENFDTLGVTNDYTLQIFRVADPVDVRDAATKLYVDRVALENAQGWANHVALDDVKLLGQPLRITPQLTVGRVVVSNEMRMEFAFAGTAMLTLSPGFTAISNGVTIAATNGVTIYVATNHAPGPFRVLQSSDDGDSYTEIPATNSWPSASGTNYTLTFPAPAGAGTWLYQVGRSNAPSVTGLPALASAALYGFSTQPMTTSLSAPTNVMNYATASGVQGCFVDAAAGIIVTSNAGTYVINYNGTAYSTNNQIGVRIYTNGVSSAGYFQKTFRLTSSDPYVHQINYNFISALGPMSTNQIKFSGGTGYDGCSVTNLERFFTIQQIR
jgi:hypothetical protein